MHVARQHLLAGAAFAGDQHRGVGGGDLLGELDHLRHRVVAIDHFAVVVGDGREHRRDQLGVGRQRDVFLGAGVDGVDRGARVIGDAAGDDRHVDALGVEPRHQVADVEGDVDHQQIGAAAGAQHGERLLVVLGVGDRCALVHRDLARGGELASERADDQESHGLSYRTPKRSRVSNRALVLFGLDDFRHGHAELVLDQHDFAARDQAVVDVDIDRLADLAVEFEHGAGAELEQVADRPCGRGRARPRPAPARRTPLRGRRRRG